MTVGHNPPVPASSRCCIWLSGPGCQDLDKRTLGFRTSTDTHTLRTWVLGPRRTHESSPSYGCRPMLGPVSYLFPVTFLCDQWSQTEARMQPHHFFLRPMVTDRQTHAHMHATSDFIYKISAEEITSKSIKISHILKSKSYQINSIESCSSSTFFQQHQKAHSNSSVIFPAMYHLT